MSQVIVNLSDKFRLTTVDSGIALEESTQDGWIHKYSYLGLGEALQGYVRHTIAKLGQMSITASVLDLLEAVQKLDATVGRAYNDLLKRIDQADPVELACICEDTDGTE